MRLPNLSQEADEVSSRIGYYMHPYEWSDMMKTVSKIATILVSPAATTMTYRRALIVLELVTSSIKQMLKEREEEQWKE